MASIDRVFLDVLIEVLIVQEGDHAIRPFARARASYSSLLT
jgi:hypothetical protein